LATHPQGGYGLEAAILGILEAGSEGMAPHEVAQKVLAAATNANDEQMEAIGRALAARARALAEKDLPQSRAIGAEVIRVRNPALKRSFSSALGTRVPGIVVPAGTDGGGLDNPSPN
jgi:hypothetical protein